jgi:hypothetical protein
MHGRVNNWRLIFPLEFLNLSNEIIIIDTNARA